MVTVTVHKEEVVGYLKGVEARLRNLAPVMADFAGYMQGSIRRNFEAGGRPAWAPLKESTVSTWAGSFKSFTKKSGGYTKAGAAAVAGRRPLIASGRLMNSINAQAGGNSVTLASNVLYARIHQYGGATGPREIKPRNKKALFWPGAAHPVRVVHHPGSKIPARPFLMFQDEDLAYLQRKLPEFVITSR